MLTVHSTEFGRCGNVQHDGQSARIRAIEQEGSVIPPPPPIPIPVAAVVGGSGAATAQCVPLDRPRVARKPNRF